MVHRGQRLGVDEVVGQFCVSELLAPGLHGVVDDLLLGARAILLEHLASVGIGKHRLDPRRHVARVERDGAGRRDRGQQRVADAVLGDRVAHILVHLHHVAGGEVLLGVEERERALLLRESDGGEIGGARDALHPGLGLRRRLVRSVAQPHHQERVGKACDAEADAALVAGLLGLRGQWEVRGIDDIVHHAHRESHEIVEFGLVELGTRLEFVLHQLGEVDRPQQAGAIGRQRLLAAGVGGRDVFAIAEIVHLVDAVDEDHTRLSLLVGRLHDRVPQIARLHGLVDLVLEDEVPGAVGLHGLHERVGDENRHVEHAQPGRVGFRGDEGLDVGVVAAHRRHHRAAAAPCRHDGAAHRVPDIHEGQGARRVGGHALHLGAARPDGREVVADAAALLHRQRGFLEHVEDARHRIGHGAHHEAVEQRHRARGPRPGGDPASRQVAEILECAIELFFPMRRVLLGDRQRAGDAAPAIFDRCVDRRAVAFLEAILHVPDLLGDRRGKTGHEGGPSALKRIGNSWGTQVPTVTLDIEYHSTSQATDCV